MGEPEDAASEPSDGTESLVDSVASGITRALGAEDGAPPAVIGRYRVRRLVGAGGMGRVYLARDATLGRSVALKIIRTGTLDEREVDRFVGEARITARLSHPNIVVVYDVGQHEGLPYLALELLQGESLRQRIERDGTTLDERLRILSSVAQALRYAHAQGVVHCDLKPSNVVIGSDGRVRVVDFGLARSIDADQALGPAGTPDYMAPEQWGSGPLTDKVDVWALGVLAYDVFTRSHPFGRATSRADRRASIVDRPREPEASVLHDVPSRLSEIVLRSLAAAPAARPSAADWCDAIERTLGVTVDDTLVPYRGLAAFHEEHASSFFGRETETDAYLERLRRVPMLPIIGPSGAGKSSFLRAGVVGRLLARGRWKVVLFRPGTQPLRELARELLRASEPDARPTLARCDALADTLRTTPTVLALRLAELADRSGCSVFLAVDQLEELFTHDLSSDEVAAFLRILGAAVDETDEPVRVAVTLRDDFVGRAPLFRDMFVLSALGPEQLRRAIVAPLERRGFAFEDAALPDRMVSALGTGAGGLPMLQFACEALWARRDPDRRVIPSDAYERIGGVAGALAHQANAILGSMRETERAAARRIFLRLVSATQTRRVTARDELVADVGGASDDVLVRLVDGRLLVQRHADDDKRTLVELAHESLITTWPQLASWLDESREERSLLHELEEAAQRWKKRGEREEETWEEEEIVNARRRAARLDLEIPVDVEGFLTIGESRAARRRRRRRWQIGVGIGLASVLTAGSLLAANAYRDQKIAAEDRAETLLLASGNLGIVDLVVRPFDRVGGTVTSVDARDLPNLRVALYAPLPGDPHRAGDAIPPELARIRSSEIHEGQRVERVEVRGGAAFLRIDGRGRAGEACPPSWIRIQEVPGFAERKDPAKIVVNVPTCRASLDGMIEVPAGKFVYGGPGVPPTTIAEYVEAEHVVDLPAFWIDRTEVSNGAFAPFAEMSSATGYPVPLFPKEGVLVEASGADRPVVAIDAYEAEAFCRFMGKRLPGDHQWTKAARGGLDVNGVPNPEPRRLYPWGADASRPCANRDGTSDGFRGVSPVDALACGASPYGILNLVGNVAEWISQEGQVEGSLRVVRGGDYGSAPELELTTTVFRNGREPRYFDFGTGVRCVTEESEKP